MTTPSREGPLAVSTSEASGEAGIGTERRRKARTLFDRLDEQGGGYARAGGRTLGCGWRKHGCEHRSVLVPPHSPIATVPLLVAAGIARPSPSPAGTHRCRSSHMRPVAFGSAVSPSRRAQLCAANARAHVCTHARMHANARARALAQSTFCIGWYTPLPSALTAAHVVCHSSQGCTGCCCTSINSCAALRRYPVAARVRDCPAPSSDARRSACWASSAQPMRQKTRARG
jgi:hypothetical protein